MIAYFGTMYKIEDFTSEGNVQNANNVIGTIGLWLTSDIQSAKPYAIGTETVYQKSETDFWEDGKPKVIQVERRVTGYIYKLFLDEPNLKIYDSNNGDSYELFMNDRDKYCEYIHARKRNFTWKDEATLLNMEEANEKFRNNLIHQGYEGFVIRNYKRQNGVTDLYCLFSIKSPLISDIIPVETL
ncbi:hypothetical protein N0O92_17875 [Alkalihalobacillus sp. MEB130]|uniref:hypothetical protein n=1 Tax=Alkalihalobacillus sp. MEB130 TaxID=2976704 RepID=UPI0028E09EBD|nr:hypothetical protein [Alkalihalobacillus sp. MEB130]MDT8862082.1 hypothetical protein [Alkalihalobacillus sp. MEB130]